jgi:hypothetical protein
MLKLLTAIALVLLVQGAVAETEGQGRSIMFGDGTQTPDHLTTLPAGQAATRGDRCTEMLREAEALKGKPQRRSAAMERYRQECELR